MAIVFREHATPGDHPFSNVPVLHDAALFPRGVGRLPSLLAHIANSKRDRVVIRRATYDDAAMIAAVNTRVWLETSGTEFDGLDELDKETSLTRDTLRRALTRRTLSPRRAITDGRLVVADYQGEIIGSAWTGAANDPEAPRQLEVYSVRLVKAFHGTGVATALLHAALGDEPACLWVGESNGRARSFYRKAGFTECSQTLPRHSMVCMVR